MKYVIPAYRIFPLGDTALTIDFGNVIDETINHHVIKLFNQLRSDPLTGIIEMVPAYSSLTVYYDVFGMNKTLPVDKSVYEFMSGQLEERLKQPIIADNETSGLVTIPICYEKEFAPDIEQLASEKHISVDDVIHIHSSKQYRIYMLGVPARV